MKPGFTFSPSGCLVTPKGLVIGGAYQPPARDHGASADAIQRALIANVSGAPAVKPEGKPIAWTFEDKVRHYWALWRMSRRFGNPFWRKPF